MIKHTHFRTPRSMNEAFNPYAKLYVERKKESAWWYVAAAGLMIAIVLIACWRG